VEIDFSLLSDDELSGNEASEKDGTESKALPASSQEKEADSVGTASKADASSEEAFDEATPLSPREKALMARLEKVTGESLDSSVAKKEAPSVELTPQERNFLAGISDLDEVLSSPEAFNKVLLAVYNMALQEASKLSAEQIMKGLPGTIYSYVTEHVNMKELVNQFYVENPDLAMMKKTVAAVANDIAAEHPEFTTEQVFAESAKKTRELLQIKATPQGQKKGENSPAFVKQRSSNNRVKGEELSGLQKEIADLLA